ncbi:pyridoxal phosphate-dependent aminotransferase [Clostridium ganghwense]|uniref:Aminotransferase n=1 Tax=Clostridium ganghwense TaxID=312089 RepID=A0ABT4CJG1_9CLOT|nr:pyridoxal phosphate-dependent aminotransferase [Clostridium ganghwense]MCY6369188.1 pyridoxal phosphate-dependent aminotransferase [Clostridium ganghwense]
MKISNRVLNMNFSPIRKLVPFANDAKKRGIKVYSMNIGQPNVVTPDSFFQGLTNYNEKIVKYSDSQGISILINSFIESYKNWNIDLSEDEILITQGGSEAILFSLMAICDPGDEVLVPEPFYSNYNSFTKVAGAKIVPFSTKIEHGFHLPPKEEIVKKITDKTRCILFSNPANPTGTIYTHDELKMLADIAKEHDLYLISDEVYRQFVYDDIEYTSCMYIEDVLDRVILVDSISKHYSACGARIGLVASKNKTLINQMLKLCQSRLCVSTIEQCAASNLINTLGSYLEDVKTKYKARRNLMCEYLSKIPGVVFNKPSGAFYILAELPVDDTEKFAEWLLTDYNYENKTVMIAPGSGFYGTDGLGKKEVRLSFCTSIEDIENSMIVLTHALKDYNALNLKK